MLTRKQADKIRNLHNECILTEYETINAGNFPKPTHPAIIKNSKAKQKFNKYVESLVKQEERHLDWTTIPIPGKKRGWNERT